MSLLQELPNPKQLDGLLAGKFSPAMLGVDDIKSNINVNELSNNITLNAPHGLTGGLTVPSLPTSLSKEGFIAQLSGPLDGLKSINSASLIGNISSGSLPVTLPKPIVKGRNCTCIPSCPAVLDSPGRTISGGTITSYVTFAPANNSSAVNFDLLLNL
jgi:hypothetical protein